MSDVLFMLVTIGDTIPAPANLRAKTEMDTPIRGVTYSGFVIPEGGTSPYTYAVISGSIPAGMSFNTSTGELTGTPTTQGFYEFEVEVTDALSVVFSILLSLTVKGGLTWDTTQIPVAEKNVAYDTQLAFSGGTPPYTLSVVTGSPPFTITASGASVGHVYAASPPFVGTVLNRAVWTLRLTDSVGNYTDQIFTSYIWPELTISGGSIPDGLIGLPYDGYTNSGFGVFNITLYGLLRPPITWSITSGALPDGLSLNPVSGHITGTPTLDGDFTYDLTATDSLGGSDTLSLITHVYSVSDIDKVFSDTFGDGSSTNFTITHNLNVFFPKSVMVFDFATSPVEPINVTWQQIDADSISIDTAVAPATDQYLVIVSG